MSLICFILLGKTYCFFFKKPFCNNYVHIILCNKYNYIYIYFSNWSVICIQKSAHILNSGVHWIIIKEDCHLGNIKSLNILADTSVGSYFNFPVILFARRKSPHFLPPLLISHREIIETNLRIPYAFFINY